MYSPEVTIVAASTGALILGLGLGFRLGKLYGMKLGIAARDFAKSFGIGDNAMQAGVGQGPFTSGPNPYGAALGQAIGAGGAGGYSSLGGAGGGYGHNSLADLYNMCLSTGMSHADAQKAVGAEMQIRQKQAQYAQVLGQQKKLIP